MNNASTDKKHSVVLVNYASIVGSVRTPCTNQRADLCVDE